MKTIVMAVIAAPLIFWGGHWVGDGDGYDRAQIEFRDDLVAHNAAMLDLQADLQAALDQAGQAVAAQKHANQLAADAIQASESKSREAERYEQMWKKALSERDRARTRHLRVVDLLESERVYIESVQSQRGLPPADDTSLLPEGVPITPTAAVADSLGELVKRYSACATDYNGIYSTCQQALKKPAP